jgi:hypothetical protein
VLKLGGREGPAFLKLYPHAPAVEPRLLRALGSLAPQRVPTVIAAAPDKLLLLPYLPLDPEGVTHAAMLEPLVDIQCAALRLRSAVPSWPSVPVFVEQLAEAIVGPSPERPPWFGAYLDEEDADLCVSMAAQLAPMKRCCVLASRAPRWLEHNDIHPGNLGLSPHTGSVLLADWNDALWGPWGTSLPLVYGSCHRLLHVVRQASDPALERYIQNSANALVVPPTVLRATAPAAAVAGTLWRLIAFASYPETRTDPFVRALVAGALRDVLETVAEL